MIIAYKDGKWYVSLWGWVLTDPDHSDVALDMNARVIQWMNGLVYWRWSSAKSHCLDIQAAVWGTYAILFEPIEQPKTYRYKGQLYSLQRQWKWDHRPRRGKYNRSKTLWTVVKSIDGASVEHLPQAFQPTPDPLTAMERFVWFDAKLKGWDTAEANQTTYLI